MVREVVGGDVDVVGDAVGVYVEVGSGVGVGLGGGGGGAGVGSGVVGAGVGSGVVGSDVGSVAGALVGAGSEGSTVGSAWARGAATARARLIPMIGTMRGSFMTPGFDRLRMSTASSG